MKNVVSITEYRNRELISLLEALLTQAKSGELTAIAFACKLGPHYHGIGMAGDYSEDPLSALGPAGRLFSRINTRADELGLVGKK